MPEWEVYIRHNVVVDPGIQWHDHAKRGCEIFWPNDAEGRTRKEAYYTPLPK